MELMTIPFPMMQTGINPGLLATRDIFGSIMHFKVIILSFFTSSKHAMGIGPYDTVISWDYYYYPGKPRVILDWTFSFECDIEEQNYPTPMDGVNEWTCSIWPNCRYLFKLPPLHYRGGTK